MDSCHYRKINDPSRRGSYIGHSGSDDAQKGHKEILADKISVKDRQASQPEQKNSSKNINRQVLFIDKRSAFFENHILKSKINAAECKEFC